MVLGDEPLPLSGWQRIGVVASVIWALVGPVYVMNKDIEYASKQASVSMHRCYEAAKENCLEQFDKKYTESRRTPRGLVGWTILAFIPTVAAWSIAWGLVALLRWIRG
jgi:hypothetical protein